MRARRLVAALALIAVGAAPSAAAPEPAALMYEARSVHARWFVPMASPGRVMTYSVRATVRVDAASGETTKTFRASRLRCRVLAQSVECDGEYGKARLTRGVPDELTIADDLSSARLVARDRFGETTVTWTAAGTPRGYQLDESCPAGAGFGFGLFQPSGASGTMWGRALSGTGDRDSGGVTRFVSLSPC